MNEFDKFESKLLNRGEAIKNSIGVMLGNMGRLIAAITALFTIIITFTDVTFADLTPARTVPSLLLLITSSYIIYFSLEDAGENLGKRSEEYINAKERYIELCNKISGDDIEPLRRFIEAYCREELDSRRRSMLFSYGLSLSDLEEFRAGKRKGKKHTFALRRVAKLKPAKLSIQILLSGRQLSRGGELQNPGRVKLWHLLLKLLPTTICMSVTVSVMLNVKSGMSASDVLNAILKLSALPMVGFRGYSAGYSYSKNIEPIWYRTRADIIDAFLKGKAAV